jgi:hypothetical protein
MATPNLAAVLADTERLAKLALLAEIHTEAQRALRRGDSLTAFCVRLLEIGARELGS